MSPGEASDNRYDFRLDRFQLEAMRAIDDGAHVVVAAPTGSGKTVVAEYAIDRALRRRERSFYTAPIKALSNQKYRDLVAFHGAESVGLLTGDNVINANASIVVMTTEVLRNMIYGRSSALDGLGLVVLDEVHFLQDTYRGPVWEEVIIHTPPAVKLVCLSATIGNTAQLTEWIQAVRGPAVAILEQRRPVELTSYYLVGDRARNRLDLLPVFVDGQANPAAARIDSLGAGGRSRSGPSNRPARARQSERRLYTPGRVETVELLAEHKMLPAVYFIFSRKQCREAAQVCLDAGLRLTTGDEQARIAEIVTSRLSGIDPDDLEVLEYASFVAQLASGIAAHHAGMVPPFKEVVERCFAEGLVKVVFATETLAVGINMPARSVVIEKLTKYTGEHHEFLTPGEYTQLTGRAGRRGIDDAGYAVVSWSPFVRFDRVATLVASRSFHLRSAFRPTYNMAANLVRNYDPDQARHLLKMSFAQFQADSEIVKLEARLERQRLRIDDLVEQAQSPYGDIWAYRAARDEARSAGARTSIDAALDAFKPGAVIWINRGKYAGPAVVVSRSARSKGTKVAAVTAQATLVQLTAANFTAPPEHIGSISVPHAYQPDRPSYRKDVARRLARTTLDRRRRPSSLERSRAADEMAVDPVENDPDLRQRIRAAGEAERVRREIAEAERRLDERNASLATEFDSVLDVLTEYGYVEMDGRGSTWSLTGSGAVLARLFHETELLVVECLKAELFEGLGAADLAGLLSVFVYEHRSPEPPPPAWFPSADVKSRWRAIARISDGLAAAERSRGLVVHRAPDPTFLPVAFAWVAGEGFAEVVADEDLSGGDFVRTMKQLVDLARQIGVVAEVPSVRRAAGQVAEAAFRGVVADAAVGDESDQAPIGESG
ncbi:MAG: DEAD/DEAH box helicase [Ilumatobacteraceae bacterium]